MPNPDPTYPSNHIDLGRKLRRQSTRFEKRLWYECLRYCPVRFRRQVPIGPYIVDFYCQKARLAVELDGKYHLHDAQSAEDDQRTAWLENQGITVMRFYNDDVVDDPFSVCRTIKIKLLEAGFDLEL